MYIDILNKDDKNGIRVTLYSCMLWSNVEPHEAHEYLRSLSRNGMK